MVRKIIYKTPVALATYVLNDDMLSQTARTALEIPYCF